jgi:hypothetical protein
MECLGKEMRTEKGRETKRSTERERERDRQRDRERDRESTIKFSRMYNVLIGFPKEIGANAS